MNAIAPPKTTALARLEDRWLLAAAQEVLLGTAAVETPPSAGVDWSFLLRQASLHALGPCLGRYCEERSDGVPKAVIEQLGRELASAKAYNYYLLQELVRLTALLGGRGVSVLAWKGPALAAAAYDDLGLRQCADVDLMVRPEQMEESMILLQAAGYREMAVDSGGHTRNLERESPRAIVELHQMVVQPHFSLSMPADELMAEAVVVSTMAGNIPVPAAEKLFLMLCVHGSKHVWERLIWICDVALFIRAHPEMDWPHVWEYARQCRAARMLGVGLLLAERLAKGIVPEEELRKAQADEMAIRLANRAWKWLFLEEHNYTLILQRLWFQVALRESPSDRWALFSHFFKEGLEPSAADLAVVKLPAWLHFFYYPIRVLRLLKKMVFRS